MKVEQGVRFSGSGHSNGVMARFPVKCRSCAALGVQDVITGVGEAEHALEGTS